MTNHSPLRTKGLSVFLVVLMLASPVGSSIAFAADSGANQSAIGTAGQPPMASMSEVPITLDDSSVVEVRDGVSVWERAIFPLRANDSFAAHSSPNTGVFVGVDDRNIERDLWKESISVYETGEQLNLTFAPERADVSGPRDDFDDGRVQLIAARLNGDQELPQSQAELVEVALDNDSATFTRVTDRPVDLDNHDTLGWSDEFAFTPQQSGQYVLFLAAPELGTTGFSVTEGNLSRSGNMTIIGMDGVTVHDAPSDVTTPNSVESGENATFEVETSDATSASDVNHTIVLYDEDTFTQRSTTFTFDTVSTDADLTVSTDIKSVNGEVYLINEPSIQNVNVSDSELSPPISATTIIDMITTDRADVTVEEDAVQLDASMTAKRGSPDTNLDVGIPSNWSDGDYHWIHVATTGDGSVVGSNSGDLTVGADDSSGGDDDDDDDRRNNRRNNRGDNKKATVDVKKDNGKVTISIRNAGANERIRITTNTTGSGPASPVLDDLNVSFTESTSASLSVSGDRGATPPVNGNTDLGYFNISHDVPDETTGPVTFSFRVATDRLEERGVSTDDVQLYRYHDGEWHALETRHLGSSNGHERFEAESPGLSVFAVSTRGAQEASFEVTDASVDATSVGVGESVEVTATVENNGGGDGTYTAELVIDGETVAQQDVTVAAGGSETVTFTHSFDEAGSYEVAVGDTTAGTVEVTGGDTTMTTTTIAVSETPGDNQGGNLPIIIVFVLLVIVGAVAYLYHTGLLDEYR